MAHSQKDYYTSMVLKSNYPDTAAPFAMGAPPKKAHQPYRSPSYLSASAPANTVVTPQALPMAAHPAPVPTPLTLPHRVVRPTAYISVAPQGYENVDCAAKPTGKLYTHNPYASSCTTPLTFVAQSSSTDSPASFQSPSLQTRTSSRAATTPQSTSGTTFPVYAASEGSGGETGAIASTVAEQFLGVVGNIPATAMSSRGRHLLLNVLRLQHMDKIQIIFEELAPQFNAVAMDPHGCHVARTLLEYISTSQMEALVPYLKPAVLLQMATSTQHTRRVLQAIFEHHKTDALMPIVEVVKSDCARLSMTQQGCIAIIRIVEYATPSQKQALISALVPVLPKLATDQFGNYVVQCILKNMEGYVSLEELVESFHGHWVELSCDKYSSNVMERIIGMLKGDSRQRIVQELIFEVPNLQCLMHNNFGNYVLQAVIGSAMDQYEFGLIYDVVTPFLHTSPYGHRIEARLKGRYDALYTHGASLPQGPVDPAHAAAAAGATVPGAPM